MESGSENDLRKVLHAYLADNEKVIQEKLKVGSGPDRMAAVHQMRVATKKIRSVMRLIAHIQPDEFRPKKEIRKLRMLFRFAGIQRELRIDRKVLTMYEDVHLTVYKHLGSLMEEEQHYADYLFEQAKKDFKLKSLHRPIKKAQGLLKEMPRKVLMKGIQSLANLRLKEIQQVMPDDYDRVLIHKARILLKEATYLMELVRKGGDKESFSKAQLQQAKQASEIAGEWHDRESFEQWMRIQMRPDGPVENDDPQYQLLKQDVFADTRSRAIDFRNALAEVIAFEIKGEDLVGKSGEEPSSEPSSEPDNEQYEF